MQPSKRHPSGLDGNEDECEAKRIRSEPLLLLPPEIWELIFRNLNAYWLRSARLTCSTWNRIIRSSSRLMERFVLVLTKDNFSGEDRKHARKVLADGAGYTRAMFLFVGIGPHKPRVGWLCALGTTLQTLSLSLNCTHVFLAQLLKEMPNLKQINIQVDTNANFRNVVPDFRLDKLEELRFGFHLCQNVVSFFSHICPRLRILEAKYSMDCDVTSEMISFIRKVSKTLKELKVVDYYGSLLEDLTSIEDLRLKRINVCGSEQSVGKFLQSQPDVEQLYLSWWTLDLNSVALINSLSKLRELTVRIHQQDHQILQNILLIEKLSLRFDGSSDTLVDFSRFNLSKLRSLELSQFHLWYWEFLDLQLANITTLILKNCSISRCPEFHLLQSLEHLELESICSSNLDSSESEEVLIERCSSLVSLKLCVISADILMNLAEQFSNVKLLELGNGVLDATNLQLMTERFRQLKELRCSGNYVPATVSLFQYAVANFSALEKLVVLCCKLDLKLDFAEALRGVRQDVAIELHVELFN